MNFLSLMEDNTIADKIESREFQLLLHSIAPEDMPISVNIHPLFIDSKKDMMILVKKQPYLLSQASDELKQDRDLVRAALKSPRLNPVPIQTIASKLLGPIFAETPKYTPLAMAHPSLHNDRELINLAIQRDGIGWFRFASEALKADKEFLQNLFTLHPDAPFEEAREYFDNDLDLMRIIATNPEFLRHNFTALPQELQQDPIIYATYQQVKKSWIRENWDKTKVQFIAPIAGDLRISRRHIDLEELD